MIIEAIIRIKVESVLPTKTSMLPFAAVLAVSITFAIFVSSEVISLKTIHIVYLYKVF